MMRSRTIWDWKLKAYPVAALLLALWLWTINADRQITGSSPGNGEVNNVNASTSAASAPFRGTTAKGDYYVCDRRELIEFCTLLPLPGER